MNHLSYLLLTAGYALLFLWGFMLLKNENQFKREKTFDESFFLLFVLFALFYDNIIVLSGNWIGEGNTLESLSYIRYFLHAVITPTLILVIWKICFRLNVSFAKNHIVKLTAYALTFGLMLYELFVVVFPLELRATYENSMLQYEPTNGMQPFMVIVVMSVYAIAGYMFIHQFRFYSLFFGTVLMSAGSVLSIWFDGILMNWLELVFMFTLLLTKRYQIKVTRKIIPFRSRKFKFV